MCSGSGVDILAAMSRGDVGQLRSVLLADDDPSTRLLCRVNLEADGFEVIEVSDGGAVLTSARDIHPGVILLDVMMPNANGFDVAEQLLADPRTKMIPIVFLSARAEIAMQLRGVELGGYDYLTKPFNPLALAAVLQRVMQSAQRGEGQALRAERLRQLRTKHEAA
jgi:two-component system, OmpR family, phosphate regulon response regulator PhoB